MADTRETIEWLKSIKEKYIHGGDDWHDYKRRQAIDHVISILELGLAFAPGKWIPVTERLPDSERIVLVSALTKTFRYRHTLMAAHIGHHEFTTEDTDWREYEGDTEYDEENDCFWIPECWYEVNAIDDNGNWIIGSEYDVTHWMPLPEPPKGE